MNRRLCPACLTMLCLLLAPARAPAADEVLKLVPDSSLGLVVFKGLASADAKLAALARYAQLPLPSVLASLQQAGMETGVDQQGALALLLLPPGDDGPFPTPVLLVPVSDYDKFVGQFQPQPLSADLTQVQIGGATQCARKLGGYAAITKTTCREILQKDLKVSAQIPPALAPWQAWLGQNDVSALILPAGVTQFSRQGQQFLQMMKATIAALPNMPPQAKLGFDVYLQLLQAMEKQVAAVGLGLQLDSHHVLRLAGRMLPVPGQKLEEILKSVPPANENLLAGLPADPFAMAFAVATTPALRQAITDCSLAMMKSAHDLYGLKEEQVEELAKVAPGWMSRVRGFSMVIGVPKSGESMYSNMVGIMRVEDASAFLAAYDSNMKRYNQIVEGAKSPILPPIQVEKCEIGAAAAVHFSMKMPAGLSGQLGAQETQISGALFGPSGTLDGWVVQADAHRLVMGYVDKQRVQHVAEAIRRGRPDLSADPGVAKTAALLPPGASLLAFVLPAGMFDFTKGVISALLPPQLASLENLPALPPTPPLGFAAVAAPHELRMELVVPAEVLKAAGQYIAVVKGNRGENLESPQRKNR